MSDPYPILGYTLQHFWQECAFFIEAVEKFALFSFRAKIYTVNRVDTDPCNDSLYVPTQIIQLLQSIFLHVSICNETCL